MFTQSGISLLYVAHAAKGKIEDLQLIDRVSGSGIYARDCDALLSLAQHEDSEPVQQGDIGLDSLLVELVSGQ
jgi:RecA-family ATPase